MTTTRLEPEDLVIAVLTFRRPDEIAGLLPVLDAEIDRLGEPARTVWIVVVDNDPAASAAEAVAAASSPRVRYVSEPRPGIAAARNRALDESAGADLLVFIDDDERPVPGWLGFLLATRTDFAADAVAGTVTSEFDGELEPWIRAGEFFRRRRLPTGTAIDVAATNNLLLDLRVVRRLGVRFDDRYGLSGGEDTLFTRTLVARGARLVWCHEAVVTDRVPRDRMRRGWVVRRALSSGNTWSLTTVELASARLPARVHCLGIAAVRIAGGAARAVLGTVTRSDRHQAKGVRTLARGLGMATGAVGYTYREYRRPTSEPATVVHS